MLDALFTDLQAEANALARGGPERASKLVDLILAYAVRRGASDVHFEPTHRALEIRFRIDGVLQPAAGLGRELAANVVARLKVMAELLTYRLDIPQEGGIREAPGGSAMRVSTFPTVHGEKAVVRLFDPSGQPLDLDQLGLADDVRTTLLELLQERSGAVFLTGPSGSGKTTTIYACLRELVRASQGGQQIVAIEDPVEQVIEGVSQSQARPGREFDFARGLRSLLRQDPEVIMIGEVRDRETAAIAIEAALTGHLVITTLHAGSACGVIARLLDMGIEPYLLSSAIKGILNQRLVRRRCSTCSTEADKLGCVRCGGSGYRGRLLLAEMLLLDVPLRQEILARHDTSALEKAAEQSGRKTIRDAAEHAIAVGETTEAEIERVLGPRWRS